MSIEENIEEEKPLLPYKNEKNEYVETRTFCGMTYKFLMAFNAVFMIIDFTFEFIYIIGICTNKYFDQYFYVWYSLIIIPLFVGATISMIYMCSEDAHSARKYIPLSCILAAFTSFFVVVWISVYFSVLYPYDIVYMNLPDRIMQYDWSDHG